MEHKKYEELYRYRWSQPYQSWNTYRPVKKPEVELEPELDLTLARAVLARIMAL